MAEKAQVELDQAQVGRINKFGEYQIYFQLLWVFEQGLSNRSFNWRHTVAGPCSFANK